MQIKTTTQNINKYKGSSNENCEDETKTKTQRMKTKDALAQVNLDFSNEDAG